MTPRSHHHVTSLKPATPPTRLSPGTLHANTTSKANCPLPIWLAGVLPTQSLHCLTTSHHHVHTTRTSITSLALTSDSHHSTLRRRMASSVGTVHEGRRSHSRGVFGTTHLISLSPCRLSSDPRPVLICLGSSKLAMY